MIDKLLMTIGCCFVVWLIATYISSWSWSKYCKDSHDFLYKNKTKNKFQPLYLGVYKISEAVAYTSAIGMAVLLLLFIFELVGL